VTVQSAVGQHQGITEESLRQLVEAFYGKVRIDPLIGPVFNKAIDDWPEHLVKLQAFWSSVMLTTGRYKGKPLPAHIKHGAAIDEAAFERWLSLWAETTAELLDGASAAALQEKAGRIAESLMLGIRFSRDPKALSIAHAGSVSVKIPAPQATNVRLQAYLSPNALKTE
jgi:hemoglobin